MRTQPAICLLLLGACSDAGVTKFNSKPTAEVTSHGDGESVLEGYSENLRGVVGDPNHPVDQLLTTWLLDGVPTCVDSTPDSTGLVTCVARFAPGGGEVVLEVRDPEGGSASDRLVLDVVPTEAPTVQLLEPDEGGVFYSDLLIPLSARVADAEDGPTDLSVSWESSRDGVLTGAFDLPDSEGLLLGAHELSAGEHFLTVTVTDLTGKQGRDSRTIQVGPPNSSPSCAITAPVDGQSVPSGETVVLEGSVSDPDVPADWLTVLWSSDKDGDLGGSPPTTSGEVGLATDALSADTHRITLTVIDELGATCTDAVYLTVGSPPELVIDSPLDGAVVNEGQALEFSATVSDAEDPPTSLLVTWESDVDGVLQSSNASSDGTSRFSRDDLRAGLHRIAVAVVDSDGQEDSGSLSVTVNALPTAPTVVLAPDPATTTDDLVATASGSVDPDGSSAVTYTYAWSVDTVPSSVTGSTFPSSSTVKGSTYRVEVTPADAWGSGPSASAEITVSNTAPVVSVPTLSPNPAGRSDTLTCSASATDADAADTPTITYSWSDGTTGSTLDLSAFSTGDSVTCTALADDGDGGTDTASVSLTLSNAPPTVSAVTLSPTTAFTDDILTASATASDPDGDSLSLTWDWSVNGAVVQSGTSDTLDGAVYFEKGDAVTATLTADDGADSDSATSPSLTISNSAPGAPTVSIDPDLPLPDEELLCQVDVASTDADGDSISYSVAWDVDGVAYTSTSTTLLTDDTVPSSTTVSKELWTCTVTPSDGTDSGPSDSATVGPCPAVLEFDGVSDIVTLPPVSGLTTPFTMEAWVRVDSMPTTTIPLVNTTCGGLSITPTEVNVGVIDNCVGASGGCKSGWNNVSSWVASNAPGGDGGFLYTGWTGDWQHVAVTIDSTHEARLYIDGSFHSAKTLSRDGCISSAITGSIGRSTSSSTSLVGQVGAVRLSTSSLYSTSGFTPAYPLSSGSSTVVLYGLQSDMDAASLTDETGNGYTASISNATWTTGGPECE